MVTLEIGGNTLLKKWSRNDANTLVINLFAGPGAGKSTTAAGVFSRLKNAGVDAELVTEFAKEAVWEGRHSIFRSQAPILGEQVLRIERLIGKVDVIVTDSPPLLSAYYGKRTEPPCFREWVLHYHRRYPSMNYFIERVKPYNPNGRHTTEDEAHIIDRALLSLLRRNRVPFRKVPGNSQGQVEITREVCLRKRKDFFDETINAVAGLNR